MTVAELRAAACEANRDLARLGLTFLAFGNASVVVSTDLLDRHFGRKHGPHAYYGQHWRRGTRR